MAGIPPGLSEAVLTVLRRAPGPMRRRRILAELESRGRRVSLAGLNRALEHLTQGGQTVESPDGVELAPGPADGSPTLRR